MKNWWDTGNQKIGAMIKVFFQIRRIYAEINEE
jgi:hypothetical protein